ncbi:MAG: GNAT family N-acetyltransferase [Gemmatimonadota bacterium]
MRLAGPADAATLARLRYSFRAEIGHVTEAEADFLPRCEKWMRQRLGPTSPWRCWVVEADGGVVGQLWAQRIEKLPNPVSELEHHAYITNVYVAPERRGEGLGTRLLEAALAWIRSQDIDAVVLWPTARSRTLYARYGFVERGDCMERRASSG